MILTFELHFFREHCANVAARKPNTHTLMFATQSKPHDLWSIANHDTQNGIEKCTKQAFLSVRLKDYSFSGWLET